jgi:ribulose-5-phosphate 4-epimerase/fuculose-1-phosphate aldolase
MSAEMSDPALMASLLKAWRFLYRRGYIEGFGHLSARLPGTDRFLITRHSLGPVAIADDFLTMDMDGKKLDGRGDPPGEYPIHLEILKARPDVGSVVHYHGMHSTAFTTSEHSLKAIHTMGTLFHDGIPVYPDPKLIQNAQRGAALAKTLGPHRAVLLRAHGAAVTGASVEETTAGAFLFEENAQRAILSASMGRPMWLDDKTASETAAELMKHRGPFRRVWALVEAEDKSEVESRKSKG